MAEARAPAPSLRKAAALVPRSADDAAKAPRGSSQTAAVSQSLFI